MACPGGSSCLRGHRARLWGIAWTGSPVSAQTPELLAVPEPSLTMLEISVQGQLRQERKELEEVVQRPR